MKTVIISVLATVAIFSCKPSDQLLEQQHYGPGQYRAGFVSKSSGDTTWTDTRFTRTETVGLDSAQDSKLKAVLLTYNGNGVFTLSVTNKSACQQIVRWDWDGGFKIDSIGYPGNNPLDPKNDVLTAGQTKVFTLYTNKKTGRLKLKAQSECGNSSTLIINITTAILPIKFTDFLVTYNTELERTFIGFTIADPKDLQATIIQQLQGKEYKTIMTALGDDTITTWNIKLP